jgi:transposase-like protein
MKESERVRKFNEFKKLHQAGQLQSHEIVAQLGISKNTLYNWRKRLRDELTGKKHTHSQEDATLPSFTKIVPQTRTMPPISHYIEIAIGSTMVIRIPETLQSHSLQQIFDMIARWDYCR